MKAVPSRGEAPARKDAPRFGLRFDRGRAELVLDAPITLASGVRLEALKSELAPVPAARLSLTDGWRAFRHRRASVVSCRLSVPLAVLGALVERALGLPASVIATGPASASVAVRAEAQSLAAELAWGFDGEDLLVVIDGARAVPEGPRGPHASVVASIERAGLALDRERGALRLARPMRHVLAEALLPAGVRLPSTAGLAHRATIEGETLVVAVERRDGGFAEPAREALERARERASVWAALADGEDVLVPGRPGVPGDRLAALHTALAEDAGDAVIADAAELYAKAEPHAELAARALLTAAESASGVATKGRLARAALARTGLEVAADVARAIELASEDGASDASLAWEPLARQLRDPSVVRARGLALERAGRAESALGPLSEALRADEGDVLAQRGLARALGRLGRHDESLSAWDRVVDRTTGEARSRARLEAARAAEAAGLRDAAIARLEALVSEGHVGALALEAHGALARLVTAAGRGARAAELDRALVSLADVLGPIFAAEAADALRAAIDRAIAASDAARGRALLDALARVAPGSAELAALDRAVSAVAEAHLARTDVRTLRAQADTLRAAGKLGEAARALIEAFVQTSDTAVLRAAMELAERAGEPSTLRAVIDRALDALPAGPARASLEARRAKLEASR